MKTLLLLLICATCIAKPEPKLHFRESVTITKGFYKGCEGKILQLLWNKDTKEYAYNVESALCPGDSLRSYTIHEVNETDLELTKN